MNLQNKVALITGGSKGIGLAVARSFAAAGADVVIVARSAGVLERAANEIRAQGGGRVLPLVCDVTVPAEVQRLPERVGEAFGSIDILVNNAGAAGSHKFLDHPDDLWEWMLTMNMTSVYQVTKAIVPGMVERGWGRIINVASIASKMGFRYMTAYVASKHGLLGFTRALAVELNPHNITVNAICPSYVNTPMTDAAVENIVSQTGRTADQSREYLERTNPQNRLIEPEEVAAVALLLVADDARGITGQAVNVDGGMAML